MMTIQKASIFVPENKAKYARVEFDSNARFSVMMVFSYDELNSFDVENADSEEIDFIVRLKMKELFPVAQMFIEMQVQEKNLCSLNIESGTMYFDKAKKVVLFDSSNYETAHRISFECFEYMLNQLNLLI